MTVLDVEPKDPPHIFCLSMTVTEDRILREIYRSGGRMSSETLRSNLVLTESADNVYGALGALREMRYLDAEVIDANDWQHNYRPLRLSLTSRGRHHVVTTEPVRTGWTRVFLSLILVGAVIVVIQSLWKEPDYGPVGLSMLTAGIILLVGRRAGKLLTKRK